MANTMGMEGTTAIFIGKWMNIASQWWCSINKSYQAREWNEGRNDIIFHSDPIPSYWASPNNQKCKSGLQFNLSFHILP